MKPDERQLWRMIALLHDAPHLERTPRAILAAHPTLMHPKRMWAMLDKWVGRGLYEYGVCLDLGWLTPAGITFAKKVLAEG